MAIGIVPDKDFLFENKYFKIEKMVTHHKCFSCGLNWGIWYIEFHIGWHMISFGDNHIYSESFYEKNLD